MSWGSQPVPPTLSSRGVAAAGKPVKTFRQGDRLAAA